MVGSELTSNNIKRVTSDMIQASRRVTKRGKLIMNRKGNIVGSWNRRTRYQEIHQETEGTSLPERSSLVQIQVWKSIWPTSSTQI